MNNPPRRIEVHPYNPTWKTAFLELQAMLQGILGDLVLSIEHVGSTSVEGLAAKPIIDIDVVMESYEVFPSIVERLAAAGFEHRGDLGIAGRLQAHLRRRLHGLSPLCLPQGWGGTAPPPGPAGLPAHPFRRPRRIRGAQDGERGKVQV